MYLRVEEMYLLYGRGQASREKKKTVETAGYQADTRSSASMQIFSTPERAWIGRVGEEKTSILFSSSPWTSLSSSSSIRFAYVSVSVLTTQHNNDNDTATTTTTTTTYRLCAPHFSNVSYTLLIGPVFLFLFLSFTRIQRTHIHTRM